MRRLSFFKFAAVLVLTAVLNTGCSPNYASMMSALGKAGNLGNVSQLLNAAGGLESLVGNLDKFTMLLPSDDALSKLGPDVLNSLMDPANKDKLNGILKNHILPGKIKAEDLASAGKTLGGNPLDLGSAKISDSIKSGGGVFHVIDQVLQ